VPETTQVSDRDLVETALRVLVAWNAGNQPSPADVVILRVAFPSIAHYPEDDLACRVIHDLSGRLLPEVESEDQVLPGSDKIA